MVQQCHPSSHERALWLRRPWRSRSEASLPLGFIFNPEDEELIVHYLCAYPAGRWDHVVEAEVYSTKPWSLLGDDSEIGYFLTKRTRHGNRVKRTTGEGTWTGQTKKKEIVSTHSEVIDFKAMFSFCIGGDGNCSKKPSKKTAGYVMYEYELPSTANKVHANKGIARTGLVLHQEERTRDREESQEKAGGSATHTCSRNQYCSIHSQRQQQARHPTQISEASLEHDSSNSISSCILTTPESAFSEYADSTTFTDEALALLDIPSCLFATDRSSALLLYLSAAASPEGDAADAINLTTDTDFSRSGSAAIIPIPCHGEWMAMMNADIFYGLGGDMNIGGDIVSSMAVEGAGNRQPPPLPYELIRMTMATATADQQLVLPPDQEKQTVADEAGSLDQLQSLLNKASFSDWYDSLLNAEPSLLSFVDSGMPFRDCRMPPIPFSDGIASSAVIERKKYA
uniref:NAC domain-containing protein n=1 Tax=Ananas comosus var. bracteatus TaxID=296719 RepID=A0A6V7PEG0_ANACO|nr:unnamed protein product [Ananas comosus var. bracteatus]